MHAIHVDNRNLRKLLFAHAFDASEIDAVHHTDRRLVAFTEYANTAMLAKEVVILFFEPNSYFVRSFSPLTIRNPSGFATLGQNRVRRQIEQLQRKLGSLKSSSASITTRLQ
jgi:hypothetical protein